MKLNLKKTCAKGFTLIELLIVIGIIAVLVAAILPLVSGTRETALAAKCMSNMSDLVKGTIAYANQHVEDTSAEGYGHFPAAGHYRSVIFYIGDDDPYYLTRRPWISNVGDPKVINATTKEYNGVNGAVAHFTDSEENSMFAVTNGIVWSFVGKSYDTYRCPVHTRNFENKHGRPPAWSFVMNKIFGYDEDGEILHGFHGARVQDATIKFGENDYRSPDKVLMYAEVQGADIVDKKHDIKLEALLTGGGDETDAILQYDKEDIGFNHPFAKGRYCGHVAFADGHVEKIVMPVDWSRNDLTRYLCEGKDVPHDGRKYNPR